MEAAVEEVLQPVVEAVVEVQKSVVETVAEEEEMDLQLGVRAEWVLMLVLY